MRQKRQFDKEKRIIIKGIIYTVQCEENLENIIIIKKILENMFLEEKAGQNEAIARGR